MSFRDNYRYKQLRKEWWDVVVRAHEDGQGTRIKELDGLMLASFRLHRCIKYYLRNGAVDVRSTLEKIPLLPGALKQARKVVGQVNGLHSLMSEADALEGLSRSCYKWLKDNKKLIKLVPDAQQYYSKINWTD
jgi:hypothetical protein